MRKEAFLEHLPQLSNVIPQITNAIPHIDPHTFVTVAKHVGGGTAAHILSNAALKFFRGQKSNRMLQSLGELGVKHGLEGKQVHPFLMDRIKQVVGPEAVAEYSGARKLVSKGVSKVPFISNQNVMKHVPAPVINAAVAGGQAIAKRYYKLNPDADIANYPILGNVQKSTKTYLANGSQLTKHEGISGKLINGVTNVLDKAKVQEGYSKGLANRKVRDVANAAVVAGTFPVPGVGDHILINTMRDTASRLPAGKGFLTNRITSGLNHDVPKPLFGKFGPKVVEGKGFLGKAKRMAGDYLYSPTAWGEAYDFGAKASVDGMKEEGIKKVKPILDTLM